MKQEEKEETCLLNQRRLTDKTRGPKTVLLPVSVKEDSLLDRFPAYGTFLHSIPTHLTGSMTTQENHILQSIQTNGTHGLLLLFKGKEGNERKSEKRQEVRRTRRRKSTDLGERKT